jgi:hypothetical protein
MVKKRHYPKISLALFYPWAVMTHHARVPATTVAILSPGNPEVTP